MFSNAYDIVGLGLYGVSSPLVNRPLTRIDFISSYTLVFQFPILIVMSTIWEMSEMSSVNGDRGGRNVSVVLSCFGDVVTEQHKQTPFRYPKPGHIYAKGEKQGHLEELSFENKTIHIIDIEGAGRFFTLICLDVLNDRIISLQKKMRADVVLAPTFSQSGNMRSEIDLLVKEYWSIILLCNSCSALCAPTDKWIPVERIIEKSAYDANKIGFILTPAKMDTRQTIHEIPFQFSESCIFCQRDGCPGRIFDIHYNEFIKIEEDSTSGWVDINKR